MKAVIEKREMFQNLSSDFALRLKLHLLGIFEQYVSIFSAAGYYISERPERTRREITGQYSK